MVAYNTEGLSLKATSMDLRVRILLDRDEGMKTSQVAAKYRVSPAHVGRLKQRRRETGEIEPRRGRPGPKPKLSSEDRGALEQ